jgi:DNA adenine methylase
MAVKPFLKWAGGKHRIADIILAALPPGKRFVEPFAGSATLYLNAPFKQALVSDSNGDLIALYRCIEAEGSPFIEYCRSFFSGENNCKERFYEMREQFNRSNDSRERAALLLYLNRHAFNGLVRYNSSGGFNVPFGRYKRPYFPLAELSAFHVKTGETKTRFIAEDFRTVFDDKLKPGDVVYCDPPYAPLSATANFTAYAGTSFGLEDQGDLAARALKASKRGIPVIISNHDTEFTRALYSGAEIMRFDVRRSISCNGSKRGAAPELLAIYR